MKLWTAHEKPRASPVLVREGFSVGALLFGPIWLAAHRSWLPAVAALLLAIIINVLTRPPASTILTIGLAVLTGLTGHDLVRWSIARRGYLESNIVAGGNEDEARAKLFSARPELVERSMVAESTS